MAKKFFSYVLPSMLAFAFSGLYSIVDGFFIGRGAGDAGLAAVSLAYPVTALIQAVGTGIGMGGAIQVSIARGRGDRESERRYFGNTLFLLGAAVIGVMALLFLGYRPILSALGAEGQLLESASTYLLILAGGTVFQLLATGFTPLLRNFDASLLAMGAMIAGFLVNIVLDWLFVLVLGYGVPGGAWATVIGQAVTLLPCLVFIMKKAKPLKKEDYRLRGETVRDIVKVGASPFGLSMCPNLVSIFMNRSAMTYGGENAVAAYAVAAYFQSMIQLLLQGVGDGSQPLVSLFLGKGEHQEAKKVRNMAYGFSLLVAFLNLAAVVLLKDSIPAFFGASDASASTASRMLPLFAAGALFSAFCRVTTSYFYSIRENRFSSLLVYGEPALLFLMLSLILPPLFGIQGVWASVPVVQALLFTVSLGMLWKKSKEEKQSPAWLRNAEKCTEGE